MRESGVMSSKTPKTTPGSGGGDAKRRNIILASIVGVAVVVVALVIILSSGGSDNKTSGGSSAGGTQIQGVTESKAMLDGIAQEGRFLGDPKAKVTIVEFNDLQCPFCKEFAVTTLPVLIDKYVRTGKVRMELRTLAFIGPDSEKGAEGGAAASAQNKEWDYTDLFYRNQGQENTGYVTSGFLDGLYKAAGMDVTAAGTFAASAKAKLPAAEAQAEAGKYGISSTPSFVIGLTGGPYEKLEVNLSDEKGFSAAIDALLK
ncbi:MAG: thioredoxin domain-containing protein [Actinobacteria bacterium]|nr:thioredoxin domain-containing protein [Actinomycetota bacterium]